MRSRSLEEQTDRARETASKGLQPHCRSKRGGDGATLWTQSPEVYSGRDKVSHGEDFERHKASSGSGRVCGPGSGVSGVGMRS